MFHVAFPRGQGPAFADLPPTLQPHAVAASAPPSDHLRSAALSGLIYLLLGGAVLAFVSVAPKPIIHPFPPGPPDRIVQFEDLPLSRVLERPSTPAGTSGGNAPSPGLSAVAVRPSDPDEAASGLPTGDRSQDPPPAGSGSPSGPLSPGMPQAGPAGPMVHDFTMVGLAVLHRVEPVYPAFARVARIQGAVVLMMTVDERGQPIQVQVLEGHPAFHEAAVQAARQWRFEPAQLDGRPVPAAFRLTLKFSLR